MDSSPARRETVWDSIKEVELNPKELEDLFNATTKKGFIQINNFLYKIVEEHKEVTTGPPKPKVTSVLDPKRSNAVSV